MVNFTSNTYQMKREILSFSNKISRNLPKPDRQISTWGRYIHFLIAVCGNSRIRKSFPSTAKISTVSAPKASELNLSLHCH